MTTQIGTRLVRPLGNEGKKIISETLNGKTYTKIIDKTGAAIRERVSTNSTQIGHRTISRRIIVDRESIGNTYGENIYKKIKDRVYNNAYNELLGTREQLFTLQGTEFIKKSCSKQTETRGIVRNFREDGTVRNVDVKTKDQPSAKYYCNNLGLPIPQSLSSNQCMNKSIKEMQAMHLAEAPHVPYHLPGTRLEHLDVRTDELPTLNKLDTYL